MKSAAASIRGHLFGVHSATNDRNGPVVRLMRAALDLPARIPEGRLREMGMPLKVALFAVMRRMFVPANALLRHRRTWAEQAPS